MSYFDIFCDEQGGLFIADLFRIALFMCLIISFIYLPGPFIKYIQIAHLCEVVVDSIEVTGAVNGETAILIDELKDAYGINPDLVIEGPFCYVGLEKRIQMRERFTVTVEDKIEVKIIKPSFTNPLIVKVPLRKKLVGVSHVYWRPGEL